MSRVRLPHVVFEVTPDCNLDCRYCYNPWKRPGGSAPRAAGFHAAADTLKTLFRTAEVLHVTFSGGEPFLSERFLELVLICRMRRKTVTVITNGTSAAEADYRSLKDVGVALVELPILSRAPEIHDLLTRRPGSWLKATKSLEILLRLGLPTVVVVVLARPNAEDLRGCLAFLREKGVTRIMLNRFNVGGAGIREWESLSLSAREMRRAFKLADAAAADLDLSISANVCTPHCILDPADYPHIPMTSCSMEVDARPGTLDAAGNVRLCNHSPTVLGNIHRTPLRDILRSDRPTQFVQTVPKPCAGCELFSKCQGGCKAAGEQLWNSLDQGDPLLRLR
jgi:radical SAM protein with 4Fe4S-binding SPASM domain